MQSSKSDPNRQIDPTFKQLIEDLLTYFKAGVQTQVEINRLPLTIDAMATVDNDEARQHIQRETPFFYFLRYNQVEFKGAADPLSVKDYHRICGRTHLYLSEHDIEPDEMTVTIICANRPQKVLAYKQMRDRFKRIQAGYYRSVSRPNVYLIAIRELPSVPQNYPLLIFTGDAVQFRTYLEQMLSEGSILFFPYAWRVQPEITEEIMMKRRNKTMTYEESLQSLVRNFGDDLINLMPLEQRLANLAPEQRLQGLEPEQRLQGLEPEQRLQGMDIEEILSVINPEQLLAGMNSEELFKVLTPEQRRSLFETMLKMPISSLTQQSFDTP